MLDGTVVSVKMFMSSNLDQDKPLVRDPPYYITLYSTESSLPGED